MISSEELEKLADDAYTDRRIGGRLYCGNCGYCLRTLPYIYQCPECGQEYNARPLSMKGIFFPFQATLPIRDALATLLWGFGALFFFMRGLRPTDVYYVLFGSGAFILALVHLRLSWIRFFAMLRSREIEKRIRISENEEAS